VFASHRVDPDHLATQWTLTSRACLLLHQPSILEFGERARSNQRLPGLSFSGF
jgi:hypothetical protein